MDAAMYPPSYHLVAAALPVPEEFGPSIIFAILDSLITKNSGAVPSLATLASKEIINIAVLDPQRIMKMGDCVETSECKAFNSLIFGNSSAMSQFIMHFLPVHRIPVNPGAEGILQFLIRRRRTEIIIHGRRIFHTDYPRLQVPVKRILRLLEVVFGSNYEEIGLAIHNDIPSRDYFERRSQELRVSTNSPHEYYVAYDYRRYRVYEFGVRAGDGEDEEEQEDQRQDN